LLSGETWEENYQKLRLVGRSEFEDYYEERSVNKLSKLLRTIFSK
jgi:hypothetical protein